MQFQDKVVLVTGAAGGIGAGTAAAFAREGAKVMLADIDADQGGQRVAEVEAAGGQAAFRRCDVSKSEDMRALVEETIARFGRLDILHNNAGISGGTDFTADISEDDWDRVIAINLKGVWLGLKYAIPPMLEQGGGVIVNTASALALTVLPGSAHYNATKHAVAGLTKTAATEYARHSIRINAVCPGVIRTAMLQNAPNLAELEPRLLALHPAGRLGEVEEVVNAVLWLASDGASFMHGSLMTVDGGWTAA
ncbi:glucose 1-dehydrogenase [Stutzerimonas tarimensis]|uniref:Glucose 1-dehydrogenase n=1 Tax=Stutzerimonas tarimensis TaxID=1507735 RepID=A0ABV7T6I8_9GAMM